MSVSEKEAGIVDTHVTALEQTARTENIFLFVRPTEFDSTVLIRAGYATKSMDVHHKSSNWGPMSGFVPCDPAFSKKCEGKPNPNEHEHKHGRAHPVQLTLKDSLLKAHEKIETQTDFIMVPAPASGDKRAVPWVAQRAAKGEGGKAKTGVGALRDRFENSQAGGAVPEYRFCTAKPADFGNKATLFCLVRKGDEWAVYWVAWEGGVGRLNPLRVFAYPQDGSLNPVTGDYDLWMVAPHFEHFDQHAFVRLQKDAHGSSAASGYTLGLIPKMNMACGRAGNPVFNHGAEEQNYGFTQALDWNLAMFTPGGTSRMVRMNQMPGILADLQLGGYLVVWNKRYGETDPRLMGKKHDRADLGDIRSEMDLLFDELDEIRRNANPKAVAKETIENRKMPGIMQAELAKMAQRFQTSGKLGLEQSRIYRFHRKLLVLLEAQTARLTVLTPADFPPTFRTYDSEVRRLHGELQREMVKATTGGGETNEGLLRTWLEKNTATIDRLKQYWA